MKGREVFNLIAVFPAKPLGSSQPCTFPKAQLQDFSIELDNMLEPEVENNEMYII